jgi:hypothetical protein
MVKLSCKVDKVEASALTISPRAISRYLHPWFCVLASQGVESVQEFGGMTKRATTAARTEPSEKKTESAVTKYRLPLGMCSKRSVPSVGMDPLTSLVREIG